VFALWALAVAQPILDLVGRQPDFLVARGIVGGRLVAFAGLLALLVPAALAGLLWAVGRRWPRVGAVAQAVVAGVLAAALALELLDHLPTAPGWVGISLALAVGAVAVWGLARRREAGLLALYLTPAAPLVAGLFLFASPAGQLLRPAAVEPTADDVAERAGVAPARPIPVVVLVLDELSLFSLLDGDGNLDAERYPGFADLARRATWYRGASTVAASTSQAVPAILTGSLPTAAVPPLASKFPGSLLTLLAPSHRVLTLESASRMCPEGVCEPIAGQPAIGPWRAFAQDLSVIYLHLLLPADLRRSLPPIDLAWGDFAGGRRSGSAPPAGRRGAVDDEAPADDVPAQVERLLGVLAVPAGGRPTLTFAHLMLPHVPWHYLPSGREYPLNGLSMRPDGLDAAGDWGADPWLPVLGWQRHLLQTGYADRVVGELLATLESAGTLDRSLVVVTADHGVSFVAGASRRVASAINYREILSVPLFVKPPGQVAGEAVDRPVETLDILPTIAEILGLAVPWPHDGRSLLARAPAPATRRIFQPLRTGDTVATFPLDLTDPDLLARKAALFPPGLPDPWLFRIGPHTELLGRPIAELAVGNRSKVLAAELDDARAFRDVDPGARLVPSLVRGKLVGASPPAADGSGRLALGVAVNGTMRAVTYSFAGSEGATRFAALVPESAFTRGDNRVELYLLAGDRPVLRPLSTEAVTYTLKARRVVDSRGTVYPLVARAVRGSVLQTDVEFAGWAGSPKGLPGQVLLFVDDAFVAAAEPVPGEGLGVWFPAGRFEMVIPRHLLTADSRVRFIGLGEGEASDLDLDRTVEWRLRPSRRGAAGAAREGAAH
jgi:hypothetical protein